MRPPERPLKKRPANSITQFADNQHITKRSLVKMHQGPFFISQSINQLSGNIFFRAISRL